MNSTVEPPPWSIHSRAAAMAAAHVGDAAHHRRQRGERRVDRLGEQPREGGLAACPAGPTAPSTRGGRARSCGCSAPRSPTRCSWPTNSSRRLRPHSSPRAARGRAVTTRGRGAVCGAGGPGAGARTGWSGHALAGDQPTPVRAGSRHGPVSDAVNLRIPGPTPLPDRRPRGRRAPDGQPSGSRVQELHGSRQRRLDARLPRLATRSRS